MAEPLLRVRDMKVHYPLFKGFVQRLLGGGSRYVHAVDGVTFDVLPGEVFGLVGESGCGKSTTGRVLLGLAPITEGEVTLQFPEPERIESRQVRPLGLLLACLFWWGSAAVYVANGLAFLLASRPFLPFGFLASPPSAWLAPWLGLAALQAVFGLALWAIVPWSRRPARWVAAYGAVLSFLVFPWGLVVLVFETVLFFYLGTPALSALIRRSGRLRTPSHFALGPKGIVEGTAAESKPTSFERWFLGPRTVRTTGLSWILQELRSRVQIIYQDPHGALNPALTLGEMLEHALSAHWDKVIASDLDSSRKGVQRPPREEIRARALELFDDVGLRPPEQFYAKRPTEISGGQQQRVVIARAIAPNPRLLVADEPVALLDMSIRAKVLELMLDLKRKYGLTYVFITHDLATAKLMCDRIAIMYLGRIVEMGQASRIYADPKHPYTRALLQAIPIPDPRLRRVKVLPKGEVPDAVAPPAGCRFHPRCPVALPSCGWEGRDFLSYLEERRLDPEKAAQEERALGAIEAWKADGLASRRKVRPSEREAVLARVREALAQAPEPMAKAVAEVGAQDNVVLVRFRPPDTLAPKEVEGRTVECLLY